MRNHSVRRRRRTLRAASELTVPSPDLAVSIATMRERRRRISRGPSVHLIRALTITLAPGSTLGPYVITALIGRGGMGEVCRAHDPRLDRDVAVKLLPAAWATDPDRRTRVEREARAGGAGCV